MQTLYCISGLGADEGAFQYLDLSYINPVFIKWIEPMHNESLQDYALRLKEKYIHEENPVVFGLSLGGMVTVEIAKIIPGAKAIIISSAKTKNEIPFYWRMFRFFPVHKILPAFTVKKESALRNYMLGAKQQRTKQYVQHIAMNADIHFYRWALNAIFNWGNKTIPSNITHIHGTNDKLLPYKYVKADISIKGGGHLMLIENANEVSEKLKQLIVV